MSIPLLILFIDSIPYQFSYWCSLCSHRLHTRVTTITNQRIKDITVLQMNCLLCGQMFVHLGCVSSLCCDQCWAITQRKYMPQISIWCCHWIFFNYINLPKLNDEQIVVLDSSLPMSEFHKALQRLPTKGSGPKGDQAVLQRSLSYISTSFFQNGHTLIMYSAFICKWNWAVAEWKSWSFAWLKKWANDDR